MFSDNLVAFESRLYPKLGRIILLMALSFLVGCATEAPLLGDSPLAEQTDYSPSAAHSRSYRVKGKTYTPLRSGVGYKARGIASWYGAESGNRTASGARFNPYGLTAAHKTLPLSSKVRVTNLKNGRSVNVVINDRGPFKGNRIIDLSKGAADEIGMRGLAEVSIEYIGG